MKKYIEMAAETLMSVDEGKYVAGSLHRDKVTGQIVFNAYRRTSPRPHDRTVRHLEHGWLKESATRYKFFNSVKKEVGLRLVSLAMHRDLKEAIETLEIEQLLRQ